uniref:Uncharacterized protein n=1 Tax=Elaeophora elaphi TaxID=1147741 RepID=A0A0R3RKQ1_9BILA
MKVWNWLRQTWKAMKDGSKRQLIVLMFYMSPVLSRSSPMNQLFQLL